MKGYRIITTTATAFAVAFVVFSCKGKLSEAESLNLAEVPLQTVDSMFFIQTENGRLKMRVEAPVMEVYDHDTVSYEIFPKGLNVYGYAEDGTLETTIRSQKARHDMRKDKEDKWSAFGNVVIRNIAKQETMETDTIYWDQKEKEIWTDCYIKMYSPSGYMQGFGMRSDDMARNAIIQRPFDSYGVVEQDSTKVILDSVNFIGPFPPRGLKVVHSERPARKDAPAAKPAQAPSAKSASKGGVRPRTGTRTETKKSNGSTGNRTGARSKGGVRQKKSDNLKENH